MKNIFAITIGVVVSIFIGTLFMKISDGDNTINVISTGNEIKAFQVAAYTNFDTAVNEATSKSGIVIKDNNYYCVYVAILKDAFNINKMIELLNDNNTYFYIKNISLSNELEEELFKYEELMKSTKSNVAFLKLNDQILKLVSDNYEN